jgi:hypothetical protein
MTALSNLPPGVTESMLPGWDDRGTELPEVESPCPKCGQDFDRHQEVHRTDANGNDGIDFDCPKRYRLKMIVPVDVWAHDGREADEIIGEHFHEFPHLWEADEVTILAEDDTTFDPVN